MSPSPFAVTSPTDPASYSWEATDEGVAARFGIQYRRVLRFDLNTSPAPPKCPGLLAANRFETTLSEYPPGDYRRLVEAAAARYGVAFDEIVPGAGADEILDMCTKAFLPAGEAAVISTPTYAMYRVHAEQRGARVIAVPRRSKADGWAMDVPAVRCRGLRCDAGLGLHPNNPTGRPEPEGAIEALLEGVAADAAADGRPVPAVVVDEAYSEFVRASVIPLRTRFPNVVSVRTASKAYAMAGLGSALPSGRARRSPGSRSTGRRARSGPSPRPWSRPRAEDTREMEANVARVETERPRLAAALAEVGWDPQPSV